jgi:undecaprenyl diphosphate synthase
VRMSDHQKAPPHIAIIMDGNGRWATSATITAHARSHCRPRNSPTYGQSMHPKNIPILSLFTFSSENWQRPDEEVSLLMSLLSKAITEEIDALEEAGVSLCFSGNIKALAPQLQEEIAQAIARTQHHTKLTLNIMINYGGKWDVLQAAQKLLDNPPDHPITEADFDACLATAPLPPPDLFIRTSGEQRISNFFLWQLAYTELYFTPIYWPDFQAEDLQVAIDDFQQRQRRYGRTGAQCDDIPDA